MPFVPELFSAPTLVRIEEEKRQHDLVAVPFFDGLMAGEPDALVDSFAGVPELHDPVQGRVKGERAFRAFTSEMGSWLRQHNASVEEVGHAITERHGFEEVVLHSGDQDGRVDLPFAIVADRRSDGRIEELRLYYDSRPLAGPHGRRPPLLQADPELREPEVVGEYRRALAGGDVGATVAAFEPDGYTREPAGGSRLHGGRERLRSFYERLLATGGISLESCAAIDDGRSCALEYNVVRWGEAQLPPTAGMTVYVRGEAGKLAAARIYDDTDPLARPA